MAGEDDQEDRTEEPTRRRLEQAIERGDVPRSQEVGTWFMLGGLAAAMAAGAGGAAADLARQLAGLLANLHAVPFEKLGALMRHALWIALAACALPFAFAIGAGLLGSLAQHMPSISTEGLAFKASRLSPMAGFKRMFGKEALVGFVKGLAKVGGLGAVMWIALRPERDRLEALVTLDLAALLPATRAEALRLMYAVLGAFALVAVADLWWQRFSWHQRQRMTRQEMKEEFKDQEGNPEIKAKLRQIRLKRAKQQAAKAVPTASVVIMNPVHYAVALRYEAGMAAPVCVAKGRDLLALHIRGLAEAAGVPVVENPPLARALHAVVEVDDEVPPEHYRAVAEVIGYVMRRGRRAA